MIADGMETGQPEAAAALDRDSYNAFVASTSLVAVDVVEIGGERRSPGVASQTRFDLAAGYRTEDDAVHYRFDARGRLTDEAGTDCGEVSASIIVILNVPAHSDPASIEQFGKTSAAVIAHPYLREALASTAQRLGFHGVLLPILIHMPEQVAPDSNDRGLEGSRGR